MEPDIAAVIVNWNKKLDVLNLLTELKDVSKPKFDVFVVDNASTDGSVDAIRTNFPNVNVIVNKTNLGGTGGFNSGIEHVCNKKEYRYIWLLDNDAKIRNDTLSELVKTMESDPRIGLAGSRIVDANNKTMTVETGGNFRWDLIGVTPVNRNVKKPVTHTVNVDYVAICSALVRVKALEQVGLMDDRLFLLWDDMDWGLCFKEQGFKVVAVPQSVAYHGSFTERDRGIASNFYYGIRNALLVYTKHTSFLKRCAIFYRSLRYFLRISFFLKAHNKKHMSKLMDSAFSDFVNNRWGKLGRISFDEKLSGIGNQLLGRPSKGKGGAIKKILVPVSGGSSLEENDRLLELLNATYPNAEITVLVHNDRADYYEKYRTVELSREQMSNVVYVVRQFIRLGRRKYDAAAAVTPSPFIYTAKWIIFADMAGRGLTQSRSRYMLLPLLFMAICCGEVAAHILFPIIMYKSLQYK